MPDGKLPKGGVHPDNPYKYIQQASWEDVPHLSDQQKEEILASYSKHEHAARSQGIPALGSGSIFPYLEKDFVVRPQKIEVWWPRAYGLDVGWNQTASVWGAINPDDGILYIYSEDYMGREVPALRAAARRARW